MTKAACPNGKWGEGNFICSSFRHEFQLLRTSIDVKVEPTNLTMKNSLEKHTFTRVHTLCVAIRMPLVLILHHVILSY